MKLKTVSVDLAAFQLLKREKTSRESYGDVVRRVFAARGRVFCEVDIAASRRVIPQVVFGRPIEDAHPLLERRHFMDNMDIPPVAASLKP